MRASNKELIEIASHMERKVSALKVPTRLEESVYDDMVSQFNREFGIIGKKCKLCKRYVAEAHEFIDCYTLPTYLEELTRP